MNLVEAIVTTCLMAVTCIYDLLTYPIYLIVQQPWKRMTNQKHPREAQTSIISHKGGLTYRCTRTKSRGTEELEMGKVDTLDKVFKYSVKRNGVKNCLGTRELLKDDEDEVQPNGKVLKKSTLGQYKWKSYDEVERSAELFSRGLRSLGVKPKDRICIFAETRAEWLLSAMAAFNQNFTIVTLYTALGIDAVIHGLNETEVEYVITSHDLLPKLRQALPACPKIKSLIYMEKPLMETDLSGLPPHVAIRSFDEVVLLANDFTVGTNPPSSDDIAIIMYTSGSTGTPKGVLLSHKNLVAGVKGMADALGQVYPSDIYMAYLPLAHIMELILEASMFVSGVPIGYSSALTLTDTSLKIKKGAKGDASLLQPTMMPVVPLILDRMFKGIQEKVAGGSPVAQALFKFFYKYKLKWYSRGFDTPMVNRFIFKRTRQLLGGRMRFMACGGAPLAPDTEEFIRTCLCADILPGYGLTETVGIGTSSLFGDMSTGRVGHLSSQCDLKLVNWKEGNYTTNDKPNPRGEVYIGGDIVSQGYFKLPQLTTDSFFEENGRRWLRTGDIGEMEPNFVLKIIDRKKDLVKLPNGEYVSLGKVESELKACSFVDNLCIHADPLKSFCVALVVPLQNQLEMLARNLGRIGLSLEKICEDPDVVQAVLKALQFQGQKANLQRFEIPRALKLCPDAWTPESGLVTAAFKLKRKPIQDFFQADINSLYAAG